MVVLHDGSNNGSDIGTVAIAVKVLVLLLTTLEHELSSLIFIEGDEVLDTCTS